MHRNQSPQSTIDSNTSRRDFLRSITLRGAMITAAMSLSGLTTGCTGASASASGAFVPDAVWGRRGLSDGRFQKPRAMTIDKEDNLYIVDMTGRIQVFDLDGNYLRGWKTPEIASGKPTGMGVDNAGNIIVADTHYFRMLTYTPTGEMIGTPVIGGTFGHQPGEFGFVTDAVQDPQGNYYLSEYGEFDRIQKFNPSGEFICQWGSHGSEPGQFMRPQALDLDADGNLWVADACNHRIQVFACPGDKPELLKTWGTAGHEPDQLQYPYGMVLADNGDVYLSSFGNHIVQRFSADGELIAWCGGVGQAPGQLATPWTIVLDSKKRLVILDTGNNRVQITRL